MTTWPIKSSNLQTPLTRLHLLLHPEQWIFHRTLNKWKWQRQEEKSYVLPKTPKPGQHLNPQYFVHIYFCIRFCKWVYWDLHTIHTCEDSSRPSCFYQITAIPFKCWAPLPVGPCSPPASVNPPHLFLWLERAAAVNGEAFQWCLLCMSGFLFRLRGGAKGKGGFWRPILGSMNYWYCVLVSWYHIITYKSKFSFLPSRHAHLLSEICINLMG